MEGPMYSGKKSTNTIFNPGFCRCFIAYLLLRLEFCWWKLEKMKKEPSLGPLHTQAKSRDHEIVRAQKKVSKGRPNTPPTSCSVVTDPQV
jgi:hypothetical protein